jgi:hypothetical protein
MIERTVSVNDGHIESVGTALISDELIQCPRCHEYMTADMFHAVAGVLGKTCKRCLERNRDYHISRLNKDILLYWGGYLRRNMQSSNDWEFDSDWFTAKRLADMIKYQPYCLHCKAKFDLSVDVQTGPGTRSRSRNPLHPSCDRVDPNIGYLWHNVEVLCSECNRKRQNPDFNFALDEVRYQNEHIKKIMVIPSRPPIPKMIGKDKTLDSLDMYNVDGDHYDNHR